VRRSTERILTTHAGSLARPDGKILVEGARLASRQLWSL
jgi:hypothetical protein